MLFQIQIQDRHSRSYPASITTFPLKLRIAVYHTKLVMKFLMSYLGQCFCKDIYYLALVLLCHKHIILFFAFFQGLWTTKKIHQKIHRLHGSAIWQLGQIFQTQEHCRKNNGLSINHVPSKLYAMSTGRPSITNRSNPIKIHKALNLKRHKFSCTTFIWRII